MDRTVARELAVEFREGAKETAPLIPRRYTLTHSDLTGELYLTIGPEFDYDKVTVKRDEVLGEWLWLDNGIKFYVYLHMEGPEGEETVAIRDKIFRKELPLALQAIRYGDRLFLERFPENDHYPILVYFLYNNPERNRVEDWGIFSDYGQAVFKELAVTDLGMDYRVLLDEKTGDVTGDGVLDRVRVYGDKTPDSDYIQNILLEVAYGQTDLITQVITELNGYNPVVFLGDFNRDHISDILFRMDLGFNSMNSEDKGSYMAAVDSCREECFDTIFTSERYNLAYKFIAEFVDFYRISIFNIYANKLFYLDICYKGREYLSRYYDEDKKLYGPVQCLVLDAEPIIPVVSSLKDNYYDLLAVHRIIGGQDGEPLGCINNLLSWDGKGFSSIEITVCAPGMDLIAPDK